MKAMRGRLRWLDLGAGAWVLETESSARFALMGEIPPGLQGRQVEVSGTVLDDAMGNAMIGDPVLRVEAIRPVSG